MKDLGNFKLGIIKLCRLISNERTYPISRRSGLVRQVLIKSG